ncbi:MAG: nucleotidyltransferase domain-containing protein [Planctomycetota bacterium]
MVENPNLVLPQGTRVVSRRNVERNGELVCGTGAVGVVVESPVDATHSYRVRLTDGTIVPLQRGEFRILRAHKEDATGSAENVLADYDLFQHVIYRCVVGSRAYGLSGADSDTDLRGIYLAPAELHWSLFGVPEQLEDKQNEECYWELQKFIQLALKANPNILECLYTPLVEHASPLATELLARREMFLSKLAYQTYNGYVLSQFRKLEQDVRASGNIKWKHAMHLIRMLLSGIHLLKHRTVLVDVGEHRDRLLAIKRGELPWEEVDAWRLDLHGQFDAAFQKTKLPERPDYRAANDFLVQARRSAAT